MIVVLVAVGATPGEAVVAGVEALRRCGHRVVLVSRDLPVPPVAAAVDEVVSLPGGRLRLPHRQLRVGKFAVRPDRLPAALRVRRLPAVAGADILVALDQASIPAVWLSARQGANVMALNGLPAAVARLAS